VRPLNMTPPSRRRPAKAAHEPFPVSFVSGTDSVLTWANVRPPYPALRRADPDASRLVAQGIVLEERSSGRRNPGPERYWGVVNPHADRRSRRMHSGLPLVVGGAVAPSEKLTPIEAPPSATVEPPATPGTGRRPPRSGGRRRCQPRCRGPGPRRSSRCTSRMRR